MAVSVTNPVMVISGVAAIFSENVAVRVTTPDVMILSESLEVMVSVAGEFEPDSGWCTMDAKIS